MPDGSKFQTGGRECNNETVGGKGCVDLGTDKRMHIII